jgi:hypothetical protein
MSLTLNNGANENQEDSNADSRTSPEDIRAVTAERERTETADVITSIE